MNVTSPLVVTNNDPHRSTRRTFRQDLLWAIPDGSAAILFAGLIYAIQVHRIHAGTDNALLEMPRMLQSGGIWPYSLSQAVGWVALCWSWLTILLGVSLPIWISLRRPRLRATVEQLHRSTSLTLIALMIVHAVVLLGDKMGDTLVTVFVPWMSAYPPGLFPQTLGIVSFYVAVLLGLTFYARGQLGFRLWRLLHRYGVPAVYVLAVWHTFLYGSDVHAKNALRATVWTLQIPILVAFAIRIWISRRPPSARATKAV
jgi:methionine sulfoxide reductase heme-binding subunit